MILTFHSGALKRLWEDGTAKGIDAKSVRKIRYILQSLDVISDPTQINLPAFHCHQLTGNRAGTYAVTIRANWRITFEWDGKNVIRVNMEDYHGR